MTSREMSDRRSQDQLDVMIRWALCDRVADVTPPAKAWEGITDRLNRRPKRTGAQWWRSFRVACASVAWWLLDSAVGPPVGITYRDNPTWGQMRENTYLCLLMYQNDLPMLLGQAI